MPGLITSSCRSASMLRIHLLACMEGTRKAGSTSGLGTETPISSSPLRARARTRARSCYNRVNAERPAPPLPWMSTSPSLLTPVLHLPPLPAGVAHLESRMRCVTPPCISHHTCPVRVVTQRPVLPCPSSSPLLQPPCLLPSPLPPPPAPHFTCPSHAFITQHVVCP